jgi:two-component system invasion response regulator UvrY
MRVLSHEYGDIVFGEAGTAEEAQAQVKARPWDVVILDTGLSDDDSLSVLRESCARAQATVLMLGVHAESKFTATSLQLGAAGYISKSSGRSDLLKTVSSVLDGKKRLSESIRHNPNSPSLHANLSVRECKVLLALAAGRSVGEIAADLNLSGKTVSTYKRRLLNKLSLKSTADLVRYAIDHKLS